MEDLDLRSANSKLSNRDSRMVALPYLKAVGQLIGAFSPGLAVLAGASYCHRSARKAAISSGSPSTFPSI